jgi:hypothetical protein
MIDVIQFVRDRLIDELREPTWKLVIGLDPEPTRDLTGEPKPLIKIIVTTPPHLVSGYPLVCSTTLDALAPPSTRRWPTATRRSSKRSPVARRCGPWPRRSGSRTWPCSRSCARRRPTAVVQRDPFRREHAGARSSPGHAGAGTPTGRSRPLAVGQGWAASGVRRTGRRGSRHHRRARHRDDDESAPHDRVDRERRHGHAGRRRRADRVRPRW